MRLEDDSRLPRIQLFLGDHTQLDIDPQKEWVMIEASTGYWEGVRHTLRALQKLASER